VGIAKAGVDMFGKAGFPEILAPQR